jgi:hypothetical protein
MPKHKRGARIGSSELQLVQGLLKDGKTVAAIARETGFSVSSVHKIYRELTPHLRLLCPSVGYFTDSAYMAICATVAIADVSKVEASGCQGWIKLFSTGKSFPLQWVGLRFTSEEFNAPQVTINPAMPAHLYIAVALQSPGQEVVSRPDARIVGEVASYFAGSRGGEALWDGKGCWLAQPLALDNPDPRLESYLPPGDYRIRVTVECEGGEGDSAEFILTSPISWEGLALRLPESQVATPAPSDISE